MDNNIQDKLIAMKYSLQNEITSKTGQQVSVQIRQLGTKRFDSLYRYDIINPANPFETQSFDVFVDRKGVVYWDVARDMNEDMSQKPIN
tara:strand:+ start:133 stop:399 length:267 start_codon:yes stop_codon:yes gene_type:complete